MTTLKCKMCGGDIIKKSQDDSVGTCESCGTISTLPNIDDDRLANFFNRADQFRRLGEFDRAISAYENILAEDPSIAEAHWGVVLSRFGIEYVEDPDTHKRIPTCHRTSYDSILTDIDYLDALQYADPQAKELYISEAQQIDILQKEILAIAKTEAPFDIFISFKDTSDGGNRTKDSVLAQDLYDQLIKEGYRVFFSRISLEDKLGEKYEPYIFSALNSAKAMIVVATDADNVKATWVRNEWSRYLALKKKEPNRLLIVCYRDMDPNDLPDELSILQCQDMSKIGFEQDLLRGLKKIFPKQSSIGHDSIVSSNVSNINTMLRRGQIFLEDGNWKSANEYFDNALDLNPECAEAYIGKLCAELNCSNEDGLVDAYRIRATQKLSKLVFTESLDHNLNYIKAHRFGTEQIKQRLAEYNDRICDALKEISKNCCTAIHQQIAEKNEQISERDIQIQEKSKEIQGKKGKKSEYSKRIEELKNERKVLEVNTKNFGCAFAIIAPIAIIGIFGGADSGTFGLIIGIIGYVIFTILSRQKDEQRKIKLDVCVKQIEHLNEETQAMYREISDDERTVTNMKTELEQLKNNLTSLTHDLEVMTGYCNQYNQN